MSKVRYAVPQPHITSVFLGPRITRANFGGNQDVSITGLDSAAAFGATAASILSPVSFPLHQGRSNTGIIASAVPEIPEWELRIPQTSTRLPVQGTGVYGPPEGVTPKTVVAVQGAINVYPGAVRTVPQPPPWEAKDPQPAVFVYLAAAPPIYNVILQGGSNQGSRFSAVKAHQPQQHALDSRIYRVPPPQTNLVNPTGIPSAQAFGALTIVPGGISFSVSGIPSASDFGTATVVPGMVIVELSGLSSAQAFGVIQSQWVQITGLDSASQISAVIISGGEQPTFNPAVHGGRPYH